MTVKVRIPTPLQKLTNNQGEVPTDARSVSEMIGELEKKFPGMKDRLLDADGKIRRFVNIYVNEEDVRFLNGHQTPLKDGDEVSIIPAIAGGAVRRVTLVFPQEKIKEPVVFRMAKKYDVIPNIRRARVTETVGEMTLELEGDEKSIEAGIKYLESQNIKVQPVTGDSFV